MKLDKSAFASEKIEVEVPNGKAGMIKLFVHELGYLALGNAYAKNETENPMVILIAECVTDAEGNKFTVDEAKRLKKEVADPLVSAILQLNSTKGQEKN